MYFKINYKIKYDAIFRTHQTETHTSNIARAIAESNMYF